MVRVATTMALPAVLEERGIEPGALLAEFGLTPSTYEDPENTIPFETRSPFQASGIRLGTPAVTTRGMKEAEMAAIADMISEVLMDLKNVEAAHEVRIRVRELTAQFPLPY
jgi:glycine/serine hydroxymethyltransferase